MVLSRLAFSNWHLDGTPNSSRIFQTKKPIFTKHPESLPTLRLFCWRSFCISKIQTHFETDHCLIAATLHVLSGESFGSEMPRYLVIHPSLNVNYLVSMCTVIFYVHIKYDIHTYYIYIHMYLTHIIYTLLYIYISHYIYIYYMDAYNYLNDESNVSRGRSLPGDGTPGWPAFLHPGGPRARPGPTGGGRPGLLRSGLWLCGGWADPQRAVFFCFLL